LHQIFISCLCSWHSWLSNCDFVSIFL
jgi:hypothetical protein